ncbi:Ras-related protein Rab-14 [Hondaea fermentalgiana]|uniref:Ras-related protein Rab-14 n=1 Tax=Hondaea fermentalgiana TaxID=2315210 RepID=A0A2R5G8X7_9STRA|nr:Ras-related protein Rab-14 [Hondaea fermentalgiana]|eukprot:GBG26228.1 Ras-related protein Rab-14 [Hondaea fermentalgiana]
MESEGEIQQSWTLANQHEPQQVYCLKVAVVGEQAVGKTSALRAFSGLPFQDAYHESGDVRIWDALLPTPAVPAANHRRRRTRSSLSYGDEDDEVDSAYLMESGAGQVANIDDFDPGPRMRAQFWDCGTRSLDNVRLERMLDGAICTLILYDVTDSNSYEQATTRWLDAVRAAAPDKFIVLIGCKVDQSSVRSVEVAEVEEFARDHGLLFMEMSARTHENVDLTLSLLRIRAQHTLNADLHGDLEDDENDDDEEYADHGSYENFHAGAFASKRGRQEFSPGHADSDEHALTPLSSDAMTISAILGRPSKPSPPATFGVDEYDDSDRGVLARDIENLNVSAGLEVDAPNRNGGGRRTSASKMFGPGDSHVAGLGSASTASVRGPPTESKDEVERLAGTVRSALHLGTDIAQPESLSGSLNDATSAYGQYDRRQEPAHTEVSGLRLHRSGGYTVQHTRPTRNEDERPSEGDRDIERHENGPSAAAGHKTEKQSAADPPRQEARWSRPSRSSVVSAPPASRRFIRPEDMTLHKRSTKSFARKVKDDDDAVENGNVSETSSFGHTHKEGPSRQTGSRDTRQRRASSASSAMHSKGASEATVPEMYVDVNMEGRLVGTISVHRGNDPSALASAFVATHRLKRSMQPKLRLIGTLHVKVGPGRIGKLTVREGDDPTQLVEGFRKTFGLRARQAAEIEERVALQLRLHYNSQDDDESKHQGLVTVPETQRLRSRSPHVNESFRAVPESPFGASLSSAASSYSNHGVPVRGLRPQGNLTSTNQSQDFEDLERGASHGANRGVPARAPPPPHVTPPLDPPAPYFDPNEQLPSPVRYPSVLTQRQRELLHATLGWQAAREAEQDQEDERVENDENRGSPALGDMHKAGLRQSKGSLEEFPSFGTQMNQDSAPLFHLDVNIGASKMERISVHQGDDIAMLAQNFAEKHGLSYAKVPRLTFLLEEKLLLHTRDR